MMYNYVIKGLTESRNNDRTPYEKELEAELASMHKAWEEMNTKRLRYREALEEILKVYSPSPVKTYQTMEDIAEQALGAE